MNNLKIHSFILPFIIISLLAMDVKGQTITYEEVIEKQLGWHRISYERFITNDTILSWQLGINTQLFTEGLYDDANDIFDSSLSPVEIIIRKQTALNEALRLRVFGMKDNFKRDNRSVTTIETYQSMLGIALGYEWQMLLHRRWKLYYGLEVEGKRIWDNSVEIGKWFYNTNTDIIYERDLYTNRTTDRISLLPLLGIRYHITPRFFISTELKMEAFYEKYSTESYSANIKKMAFQQLVILVLMALL